MAMQSLVALRHGFTTPAEEMSTSVCARMLTLLLQVRVFTQIDTVPALCGSGRGAHQPGEHQGRGERRALGPTHLCRPREASSTMTTNTADKQHVAVVHMALRASTLRAVCCKIVRLHLMSKTRVVTR